MTKEYSLLSRQSAQVQGRAEKGRSGQSENNQHMGSKGWREGKRCHFAFLAGNFPEVRVGNLFSCSHLYEVNVFTLPSTTHCSL